MCVRARVCVAWFGAWATRCACAFACVCVSVFVCDCNEPISELPMVMAAVVVVSGKVGVGAAAVMGAIVVGFGADS